jgi:protein Mpv17
LDQSVFAPASNLIFLTWMHLLAGGALDALVPYVVTTLPKVLIANWAVWPAANYIAFRFVPADMRILYANCLGVLWVIYVSAVSH